jgi:hypothetical protein
MAQLPEFSLTLAYFLFLLSVVITTVGLVAVGGIAKWAFWRPSHARIGKKLLFFPLFIVGIFAVGWLSERAQQGVYEYLLENAARGIPFLIGTIALAWVLYDWVVWRKG